VLRDFSLEDLVRRLARGETVDMATVPPRIRALLERAEDDAAHAKPDTPGPPTLAPVVPLQAE
jgi:hypothetical protein